ncbi:MAG: hypothetical protein LLG06_03085 [Desulfobacteraceae bacterium]|nr:hypothetical protein [Desulfobacteraceae bacterium]
MRTVKIMAIALIVASIGVFLYGKFGYTTETRDVKPGPVEMSVVEEQTVNIPLWAEVGAIAGGCALLVYAGRKRQIGIRYAKMATRQSLQLQSGRSERTGMRRNTRKGYKQFFLP